MRRILAVAATSMLALGASLATASQAQAAYPTCGSWTTYYTTYSTSYVTHAPTTSYRSNNRTCQLKQGNRNDAVKVLQRALRECHGYGIAVDGEFGPATRSAVLAIQRRANDAFGAGIAEDGEFGPQTRNWIQMPVFTWPGNSLTVRCDHPDYARRV